MNILFQNEDEKNKEVKKTSETESYDSYENEAMEDAEEGAYLEEIIFSKDSLPSSVNQTLGSATSTKKETEVERKVRDSEEKRKLIIEKWYSVTGKKPKNIPTIKKYYDEAVDNIIFFGDRKSDNIEKKRAEKMFLEAQRLQSLKITYGKLQQEIQLPVLHGGLTCVRFAPNTSFVATAYQSGAVQIRECFSGEVTMNLYTMEETENLPINSLKYFPEDSERLFLGGSSGVIQVFNPETGEPLGVSDNMGVINVMDISPDGSSLVTGGNGGTVCIVNPLTLQVLWTTAWPKESKKTTFNLENEYHKLRIYALKFHPTEINLFVTGGCDNSVKIWDVRISKAIRSINGPSIFGEGVDLSDNRIITASWRAENSLSLWDFPSGRLIKNISIQNKVTKYESEFLYCTQFFKNNPDIDSVNENMIAVGGSGFNELLVINIDTEKVLAYFPSFKAVATLDICGKMIAYGGKESLFRIGEIESRRKTRHSQR